MTLSDYINMKKEEIQEFEIHQIIKQILEALKYLHK